MICCTYSKKAVKRTSSPFLRLSESTRVVKGYSKGWMNTSRSYKVEREISLVDKSGPPVKAAGASKACPASGRLVWRQQRWYRGSSALYPDWRIEGFYFALIRSRNRTDERMFIMTVFEELQRRGLIAQSTHLDKIEELLNREKVTFYIGFDATADSLHVGHFLQLVVMSHLQKAGHRPIALLGTGTTMIGDPTGKSDMRRMMTPEEINHNAECFKRQMSNFIDFSDGKALMVKNGDWLLNFKYIDFIRDVGVHFSVNKMLQAECFKSRMERGLSFMEFNYMLLQSYDFLHLYRTTAVSSSWAATTSGPTSSMGLTWCAA